MTRHIHVLLPTRENVWARVVAKLEDIHARRTVMANARAGLDWFPVAPPIPSENTGPPTDFDG
jgi:hypothetical protein